MSKAPAYRLELLDPQRHDRRGFSCGEGELDIYLQRTAHRDAQRKAAIVYVLVSGDRPGRIAGYLTLSMAKIALSGVPKAALTRLPKSALAGPPRSAMTSPPKSAMTSPPKSAMTGPPRAAMTGLPNAALIGGSKADGGRSWPGPLTPATLIGRLAVAESLQGKGMGARLLQEAFIKAVEATTLVASHVVVVDPLHERAAAFYRRFGFAPLGDGQRMYLPMKTIVASLAAATGS